MVFAVGVMLVVFPVALVAFFVELVVFSIGDSVALLVEIKVVMFLLANAHTRATPNTGL